MKKCAVLLASFLVAIHLFSQPVITSFAPTSGSVGTTVTITGTGFNSTAANNIVYFGSVKASVSAATGTTLTVTVPAGATYQPITVTTNNLTAYSTNSFVVTFSGGSGPFTTTSFIPKVDFTTGNYPHCTLLADFNQDGKNDVLVSRGSSANVSILPNTTTGTTISFGSQVTLAAAGNNHEGAAVADLDGDGYLDFVITNSSGSNSISIFRNATSGSTISFAPKLDMPVDNSPYSVAAGDLDGDGKPDLAIANNGSNKICVYRNTSTPGNISFATRIDYTAGTNPYGVAIGDLDADNKPEIVFTTQGSSSALSVMKNTSTSGTISFDSPIDYASISGAFVVTIGDLDNDNKPDVVACSGGSFVVVLKNSSSSGNISFSGQQNFVTGNYTVCVSISDLNGDGKPDLVTSNRFGNNVSALRNTTTTGVISFDTHLDYAVNTDPFYVAVGDLDGDSRPDVVAANSAVNVISVLRNIIGANIAPVITSFTPTSGINGTIVTILGSNFTGTSQVKFGGVNAAFNVDSSTGISAMVGPGASGDVSVTTPNGTAALPGFIFNGPIISSFAPVVGVTGTIVTITGTNFTGVTGVQFGGVSASSFTVNSSTSITATVGAGASGSVSVTTSSIGTASLAGFSFGAPTITSFSPSSGIVGSSITITGTNFSSTPGANTVYFGAVRANVTTASSTQLTVSVPAGATYQPISVGTNNLIAYSSMPFNPTFVSDNPHITTSSFSVAGSFGTGNYPSDISIKDLNNDGKPDIVTANTNANTMSVLKNTSSIGSVLFNAKIDFATGPGPKRIAMEDLDGDSKPEIVIVNFNSGGASSISIFRNTSNATSLSFDPKLDYPTGNGTLAISITDMNADGKPDIVVTSGNSGFFSIFKNTTTSPGNISLAARQDFTLLLHPDYIITADLDKDGKPDIITSNFGNGNISVFRNTSTGGNFSLDPRLDYAVGTNPTYITAIDVNDDGKLDLAVSNYTSSTITLLKNNSTTGSVSLITELTIPLTASNISAGDLNGDNKPDLCAGRGLSGLISAIENTYPGSGNFTFSPTVDFTAGNFDTFVSVADLDGDGKPELAAANVLFNNVAILKNIVTEPAITSLSSASGGSGSVITINGRNFTGATSVKFGGTPAASFNVVSPLKIDAIVGGGASGDITVTTASGTAATSGFNFIPAITADGATTFCSGDAPFVLLTSSAAANNQWHKDGVAISGATATTLQAATSGIYTVKTTSNGITTVSPTGITVTVTVVPAPVITLNVSNQLVSSTATGNQWYLNGVIISGATNQAYQPTQSGNYTVKTTANGCTSDFSPTYNFIVTGVINLGNDQYIKLYPNPVKDKLYISWNINSSPMLNIEVSDLQGKQVLINKNISSGSVINLATLPQGVYLIKIYSNKLKINETVKIIKHN